MYFVGKVKQIYANRRISGGIILYSPQNDVILQAKDFLLDDIAEF
jgi:hypothetical protein